MVKLDFIIKYAKTYSTGIYKHCKVCVYHPPNLPANACSEEDYQMLLEKECSFDFLPLDENCQTTRKTSCSIVDLKNLKQSNLMPGIYR
jgi:hypothetical protein